MREILDVEATPVTLFRTGPAEAEAAVRCLEALRAQLRPLDAAFRVFPLGTRFVEGAVGRGRVDIVVSTEASLMAACIRHLGLDVRAPLEPSEFPPQGPVTLTDGTEATVRLVAAGSAAERALLRQQEGLQEAALRERYAVALHHGASAGKHTYTATKSAFWSTWEGPGPLWREARVPVLKVLTAPEWAALCERHTTLGAPIDERDGYVHLSTPAQVHETVARHFQGQSSLWLLTLDASMLGAALRYEPSRGGALFPHLYAPLRLCDVMLARPYGRMAAAPLEG